MSYKDVCEVGVEIVGREFIAYIAFDANNAGNVPDYTANVCYLAEDHGAVAPPGDPLACPHWLNDLIVSVYKHEIEAAIIDQYQDFGRAAE